MLRTELCYFLEPVSIVVPILIVSPVRIIVYLLDRSCCSSTLRRIVEFLLKHHSVLVTIKQSISLWKPYTSKFIGEVYTWLTALTAFCCNLDNTVSTLRTPDSCCSSIFQHCDRCDIIDVDREQRREFLFISILKIEIVWCIKNLIIHNKQRF